MNFFRKTTYILDILLKLFKLFFYSVFVTIIFFLYFHYFHPLFAHAQVLDISEILNEDESPLPASPYSYTPTISNTGSYMLCFLDSEQSTCDIDSATYDGASMTQLRADGSGGSFKWYGLANPSTGANTLSITHTGTCSATAYHVCYEIEDIASTTVYSTYASTATDWWTSYKAGSSIFDISYIIQTGSGWTQDGWFTKQIETTWASNRHVDVASLLSTTTDPTYSSWNSNDGSTLTWFFEFPPEDDNSYLFSLYPSGGEEVIGMSNTVQWTYDVHFGADDFPVYGTDYAVRIIDLYNGEYNVQDIYNFYDVDVSYPAVNILYEPVHIGYGWHTVYWDIYSIATSTYGQNVYSTSTTFYLIQAGEPGGYVGIASTTLFLEFGDASTSETVSAIYEFFSDFGKLIGSVAPFSIPYHIKESWDDSEDVVFTGLEILGINSSESIEIDIDLFGATTTLYIWGPDFFTGHEDYLAAWYLLTSILQWGGFFTWLVLLLKNLYSEINEHRPV